MTRVPEYGCGVAFEKPQARTMYLPTVEPLAACRLEAFTCSIGLPPSLEPTSPCGPSTVRISSLVMAVPEVGFHLIVKVKKAVSLL